MLAGRYAGKKAVVVKTFDQGTTDKSFAYALVAGVAANQRKVTKSMSKKKMSKKLKIKPLHQGRQLHPPHADPLPVRPRASGRRPSTRSRTGKQLTLART